MAMATQRVWARNDGNEEIFAQNNTKRRRRKKEARHLTAAPVIAYEWYIHAAARLHQIVVYNLAKEEWQWTGWSGAKQCDFSMQKYHSLSKYGRFFSPFLLHAKKIILFLRRLYGHQCTQFIYIHIISVWFVMSIYTCTSTCTYIIIIMIIARIFS